MLLLLISSGIRVSGSISGSVGMTSHAGGSGFGWLCASGVSSAAGRSLRLDARASIETANSSGPGALCSASVDLFLRNQHGLATLVGFQILLLHFLICSESSYPTPAHIIPVRASSSSIRIPELPSDKAVRDARTSAACCCDTTANRVLPQRELLPVGQ